MTIRSFRPDPGGLAALRREVEATAIPRLTEAIWADSQRFVPVLTGELKASGHTEYGRGVGFVVYGTDLPDKRAIYQEAGTSVMAAQPYLRPAAYRWRTI